METPFSETVPKNPISFYKLFQRAYEYYEDEALQDIEKPKQKHKLNNMYHPPSKKVYVGDKRMAHLKWLLDYIPGCMVGHAQQPRSYSIETLCKYLHEYL